MAMLADTLSAMITLLGKEKGRTATPSGLSEVMRQAARPRPRGRVPQPPVLRPHRREARRHLQGHRDPARRVAPAPLSTVRAPPPLRSPPRRVGYRPMAGRPSSAAPTLRAWRARFRSEEHTSELPSLMRISYAVFCLKKKKQQ